MGKKINIFSGKGKEFCDLSGKPPPKFYQDGGGVEPGEEAISKAQIPSPQ